MAKANRTCSFSDCSGYAFARGWCQAHYNRWYYSGDPTPATDPSDVVTACVHCSGPMPAKAASGPTASYCSPACRRRAGALSSLQRMREQTKAKVWTCSSVGCGATWAGRGRKWCAEHALEARRSSSRVNLNRECSEIDCERPTIARGLCSMHWKRVRAAELPKKPVPFDGARMQRHYERRTWVKAGERVTIAGLRERDGDTCGICSEPIDFALSGRDPRGRSVDHILPRSRGGAHTWANTQLAHLRCNLSKGAKVPESVVAQCGAAQC